MQFGLTNAPATFQRMMDIVLNGFNWQTCHIYLDKVIVFSKSFDAHLKDVDMALPTLRKAGVSLNLEKCCSFYK